MSLSRSLLHTRFLEYPLDVDREGLVEIAIGLSVDVPNAQGELSLEILSPRSQILRRSSVQLGSENLNMPVQFVLKPLALPEMKDARVRITCSNTGVPIRIFQWERAGLMGFNQRDIRLFCGLRFSDTSD